MRLEGDGLHFDKYHYRRNTIMTRGSVLPPSALVPVVQEDWPGVAGNGMHTVFNPILLRLN